MHVDIINKDAEKTLLKAIEQGEKYNAKCGALHFNSSKIGRKPRVRDIQLTVRSCLPDENVTVYFFNDGDLVFAWDDLKKSMLDELCKELYAYFHITGKELLHTYYDLSTNQEDLRLICKQKIEAMSSLDMLPEQVTIFHAMARNRKKRKALEILVVEDQPFSSKLLVGLLDRVGKPTPAYNAQSALELYLTLAPDIIFLDVEMPDVSGHDLAAVISKLDIDAYIIMVTANNYIEDVNRAKQNGAKGFIAKPYSKQKILEGIDRFINARKLRA